MTVNTCFAISDAGETYIIAAENANNFAAAVELDEESLVEVLDDL